MSDPSGISSIFSDLFGFDFILLMLLLVFAVIFIFSLAQKLMHDNLSFRDTLIYFALIIGSILAPIYIMYHMYLSSGLAEFLPLSFGDFLILIIFGSVFLVVSAFANNN